MRRCTSQASLVDTTPSVGDVATQPRHLRCREVRIEWKPGRPGQPLGVARPTRHRWCWRGRSCHEMACSTNGPRRDPRPTPSRPDWRSRPRRRSRSRRRRAARPASQTESHNCSGSCSTPPPGTAWGVTAASAEARISPSSPKTTALVAEVPWSMARTLTAGTPCPASDCSTSHAVGGDSTRTPLILTGGKRLPTAPRQLFPSRGEEACYRAPKHPLRSGAAGSPSKGGCTCLKVSMRS